MQTNNTTSILPFSKIPIEKIIELNERLYHKKKENAEFFKWRFRIGFNKNIEPIYLIVNGNLEGQAGLIAMKLHKEGRKQDAIWFNSFIISSQLRGKGMGKILTTAWMQLAKVQITNCNDNSMSVFRSFGWEENQETVRFALPISLKTMAKNKQWKGVKMLLAWTGGSLFNLYLKIKYSSGIVLKSIPIKDYSAKQLQEIFLQKADNKLLKDEDWFKWRLLSGPFSSQYALIQYGSSCLIYRDFQCEGVHRIHIVYQTEMSNMSDDIILIKSLIQYAILKGVELIWALTNITKLKEVYGNHLSHKLPTRFAFYSDDVFLMKSIREEYIPIQAVDSDYDIMYS
jgi:hypothetical protein